MTKIKGIISQHIGTKERRKRPSISATKKYKDSRPSIKRCEPQRQDGDLQDIRRSMEDLSIQEKCTIESSSKHYIIINIDSDEIIITQMLEKPIFASLAANDIEFARMSNIPIVIRIIPANNIPINITIKN